MKRELRHAFLALGVVMLLACFAAQARAYEDQISLGVGAGYGHLVSDTLPAHGVLFATEASVGLDDIWTLRAGFSFDYHPAQHALALMLLSTELLYLVDVLEIVPYFGAGVDGVGALRSGAFAAELGVHPVFGLDWLASRELVFGLALRPIFLVSALDEQPFYFTGTLSAALLFDF